MCINDLCIIHNFLYSFHIYGMYIILFLNVYIIMIILYIYNIYGLSYIYI